MKNEKIKPMPKMLRKANMKMSLKTARNYSAKSSLNRTEAKISNKSNSRSKVNDKTSARVPKIPKSPTHSDIGIKDKIKSIPKSYVNNPSSISKSKIEDEKSSFSKQLPPVSSENSKVKRPMTTTHKTLNKIAKSKIDCRWQGGMPVKSVKQDDTKTSK